MARVQATYTGHGEAPQAMAPQMLQTVQAAAPAPDSSSQLARALGVDNTQFISQAAENAQQRANDEEIRKANDYYNSTPPEELNKRIKDGQMLPSQSPLFMAHLQHLWGDNARNAFERDTISKLATGELKFDTPEAIQGYMQQHRNETLEGRGEYATAGYDKGWHNTLIGLTSANAKITDAAVVSAGLEEARSALGNKALEVTAPTFGGSPEEAAKALADSYKSLTQSALLRDDARKEALKGVLANLSNSGQQQMTAAFLDQKLDSGRTVREVLGDDHANAYVHAAEIQFDHTQIKQEDVDRRPLAMAADIGELRMKDLDAHASKYEKYFTTGAYMGLVNANEAALARIQKQNAQAGMLAEAQRSVAAAQQAVAIGLDAGQGFNVPQQKILSPTGEVKDFKQEQFAQEYLTQRTQGMDFGKSVEMWSGNNVSNPEWEKQIKGGVSNIASVGWTYDGKNIGTINPQGQQALDTFIRINKVNPGYAQKLAGSDKDYQKLSDIQFLAEKANWPLSDAAARVNQIERAGIGKDDYGSLTTKVTSAVDDIVNPHWYSGVTNWVGSMFGGNTDVNLTQIKSDLTRMTELLVKSGQVPDANAAVKASLEYLSNPAVTTKVNNTVYYNKDMPVVPKGEEPGKWMERYIREVPGEIAKGNKQNAKEVRLEPNSYGGFTAWIGGTPLVDANHQVVTYKKDDISNWVSTTMTADKHTAADFANFKLRIDKEAKKLPRSIPTDETRHAEATLRSLDGFKKVIKDGNKDKPLSELMKLYTPKAALDFSDATRPK